MRLPFSAFLFTLISITAMAAGDDIVLSRPTLCEGALLGMPSLQDLRVRHPEIEAKFEPSVMGTFKAIKNLSGKVIEVKDPSGVVVRYGVSFHIRRLDEDRMWDGVGNDLALPLFHSGAQLRERRTSKRREGDDDQQNDVQRYDKFVSAQLQAKDPSLIIPIPGLVSVISVRNEIQGKKFDRLKWFKAERDSLLQPESSDPAVSYVRQKYNFFGEFERVLVADQYRYYLRFRPIQPLDYPVSDVYLSLNKIEYVGLVGRKGHSEKRLLILHMADNIAEESETAAAFKVYFFSQLVEFFQKEYALIGVSDDKYKLGIRDTVLMPTDSTKLK